MKYLIYLAKGKKSEKETRTLEKVLFTVLNIPPEQEKRVEKARKKSNFWKVVGMFKQKEKIPHQTLEKQLDKDINYTFNTDAEYGGLNELIGSEPFMKSTQKD